MVVLLLVLLLAAITLLRMLFINMPMVIIIMLLVVMVYVVIHAAVSNSTHLSAGVDSSTQKGGAGRAGDGCVEALTFVHKCVYLNTCLMPKIRYAASWKLQGKQGT